MVTAELAACLPVLVLLLGVALSAVAVASAHVRAQDAAREAARAVARGDPSAASALVHSAAGGFALTTSVEGGDVTAVVVARVQPLGDWLPAITVTERATAALEPPVTPGSDSAMRPYAARATADDRAAGGGSDSVRTGRASP